MAEPPRASHSSTKGLGPEEIANHTFASVKKGLDPNAVRRFLNDLAAQVREARARETSLTTLLDLAEKRASSPELDEATLAAAVGTETARILQAAHEAAHVVLERAQAQASTLIAEAESARREHLREAEEEAHSTVGRARVEAKALSEAAKQESQEMLEEARDARRRILADLADRRRLLHHQLEQLRAGKDTLVEVVDAVAVSVRAVRDRLENAEDEARAAADDAGRNGMSPIDEGIGGDLIDEQAPPFSPGEDREEPHTAPSGEDLSVAITTSDFLGDALPQDVAIDSSVSIKEPRAGEASALNGDSRKSHAKTGEHIDVDALFARIRATSLSEKRVSVGAGESDLSPAERSAAREGLIDLREAQVQIGELEYEAPGDGIDTNLTTSDTRAHSVGSLDAQNEHNVVLLDVTNDAALRTRRDALLNPIIASLSSSLKRALRSEQNELLDSIRHLGRNEDPASLLATGSTERLASQASGTLAASFEAGLSFGRSVLEAEQGPQVRAPIEKDASVGQKEALVAGEDIAQGLARQIVNSVNRRVAEGLSDAAGDAGALASLVGFAYREWKGPRIEVLAADSAIRGFALGTCAAAVAAGATLRWLVDDGDVQCPDCDDNALASFQAVGEDFPTGHANPPVHSGCRCVLVPHST